MSDPAWLTDMYSFLETAKSESAAPPERKEVYEHPHVHLSAGNPLRNHPGMWWRVCEHCGFEQRYPNTLDAATHPFEGPRIVLPAVLHKCRRDEQEILVYWREY